MKVFISHQRSDSSRAASIALRLQTVHGIESYLDVIDSYAAGPIETLADHIRQELAKCSQLLAVVSPATRQSQWVPWEIGVATEKDFPLATYSDGSDLPPEFIRKWPFLRTDQDLDAYAVASKAASRQLALNKSVLSESVARRNTTREFYSTLRKSLGQ